MRQTTYPKGSLDKRKWLIVDVKDCILGRVASKIAHVINGKSNVLYTPYANNGFGVIVLNAKYIKVTGDKLAKPFYWHTGFAGGLKQRTIKERLMSKDPTHVVYKAVERMIPRGPLGRAKMKNLRVFADDQHCYQSLKPEVWNLDEENTKNKREIL
ncbi:50S ribosomal protein L13 [Alphaproteobacteria bacterium endosymbiont of Tiliacea citrago]|uniref:50S ribosomal protein L13 n=1 Tax=Alphaproteobacteria bacterium endosymbiont of Tiliacea citrago TaxID=3077944 RepID=UPI00313ADAB3